jgi:hypothetical protein
VIESGLSHNRVYDSLWSHIEVKHQNEVAGTHYRDFLGLVVNQESLICDSLQEMSRVIRGVVEGSVVVVAYHTEYLLSCTINNTSSFN